MAKSTGITKRLEVWTLDKNSASQRVIIKNAVRRSNGTFHGATNFRVKASAVGGPPVA